MYPVDIPSYGSSYNLLTVAGRRTDSLARAASKSSQDLPSFLVPLYYLRPLNLLPSETILGTTEDRYQREHCIIFYIVN